MNLTLYFRRGVWEKFQHEADKSALVNDLLEAHYSGSPPEPYDLRESHTNDLAAKVDKTPVLLPSVVKGSDFVPKPPDPELGYPCCQGKRPCKHWVWDGNQLAYVNSITHKVRPVD